MLAAAAMQDTPSQPPATQPAATAPAEADLAANQLDGRELARRLFVASGGETLDTVERIKFTFNVEVDGQNRLAASHDWNLEAGTDRITVNGETTEVDLNSPGDTEAAKRAFARWTNDSYWLIAPLKFMDAGVDYGPVMATRDIPPSRARVTISFDGVGLTPGDQYDLAVNLRNDRLEHWTYRPNADTAVGFTWEDYQDFNGLTLATNHVSDDGKRRIYFTDVEVIRSE